MRRVALAVCLLGLAAWGAEPVETAWILARPAGSEALKRVRPEVHEVVVGEEYVEVRSAGLSLSYLGPFQNPLTAEGGARDLRMRIPRKPVMAEGAGGGQRVGPGITGVFRNGVPLYNRFAEASYLGQNLWHFDTVKTPDAAHGGSFGILDEMIARGGEHSPLVGFANDGFPIYGPWGFAKADGSGGVTRMRSGYRLRKISVRREWAGGQSLTPGQWGPPVGEQFPLGTFAEDYEYVGGEGTLDESNGRFAVTPDYPRGTYAYFLTTDEAGRPAFPYFLGERYKGKAAGDLARPSEARAGLEFRRTHEPLSGEEARLGFRFPGTRYLEIVHEKPVHVMIVSRDLERFDHVHPEWETGGEYALRYRFPKPGAYRVFAQFTRPGEPERLETFDVTVGGKDVLAAAAPAVRVTAKLAKPERLRTGEDFTFAVEMGRETIEPYLGAWGHFVFLDEKLHEFIHAHPNENAGAAPDPMKPHIHGVSDAAQGPPPGTIKFTANFATPGRYKLWAQFQARGEAVAIPFVLDVEKGAAKAAVKAAPAGAVRVAVDASGFSPARIEARAGKPLTLAVTRSAGPNCGSRIVFPSLGIEKDLPVGEMTIVELPAISGEVAFACGMGMYRGAIVGR